MHRNLVYAGALPHSPNVKSCGILINLLDCCIPLSCGHSLRPIFFVDELQFDDIVEASVGVTREVGQ